MTTLTYKRITKTGKLVEFTYSECDKELVEKYNWRIDLRGYMFCTMKIGDKWKDKRFHRLIMGEPVGLEVDHIDGSKSNNTRSNLRKCTHSDNMKNTDIRKHNTSGYRGIHWDKVNNKWRAYITHNKKCINLGRYIEIEDAIKVRKEAEEKYFGEFRRK